MPTIETHSLDPKQLAAEAASCMQNGDIDYFIEACVLDTLKQTVENHATVIADTHLGETNRPEFTPEEITQMKECKLEQISFSENPQDTKKFRINIGNNRYILFSNRPPTRNELRGELLKKLLGELKETNPKMTLYDALAKLIQNPTVAVTGVYLPIFGDEFTKGKSKLFVPDPKTPGEYADKKDIIINSLIKFASACVQYVKEGRKQGFPDEELTVSLKHIIATYKNDIFTLALDESNPPTKEIFLKFIERKLLKQASHWTESLDALAQTLPPESTESKTITELFVATNALLKWQQSEDRDPDVGRQLAEVFNNTRQQALELSQESKKIIRGSKKSKQKATINRKQIKERLGKTPEILLRLANELTQLEPAPIRHVKTQAWKKGKIKTEKNRRFTIGQERPEEKPGLVPSA